MGVIGNRRGSILILIMGIIVISGILMTSLIQLVVVAKQQMSVSKEMIRYSSVLDSLLDYGIHGLKHRWCFSATMLEDVCAWDHSASSERLIMNDHTARALGQVVLDNPTFPAARPFRLTNFAITVPIANITGAHPLFQAVLPAQSAVFNSITYNFDRVTNTNVPERGDEAIVRIKVSLNSSLPLFRGLTDLVATSTLIVYPRVLSEFAAIIPRDLRMDLGSAASDDGDWNINMFASRSTAGTGIIFESPVYVNRDAYIPAYDSAADPAYAPATFAQKVVLGTGRVMEGGALMSPQTPGGIETRFYDSASGIGGFLKGIEIDGSSDAGLDAWIGAISVPAVDLTKFNECKQNTLDKNNLENSKNSPLYISTEALSLPTKFMTHLSLGANNQFYPQDPNSTILGRSFPTTPGDPMTGGFRVPPTITSEPTSIGYVFIGFGPKIVPATVGDPPYTWWIRARLGWNTVLQLPFADRNGVAPNSPPTFSVTVLPVNRFGVDQPNEAILQFELAAGQDWAAIPSPINVYFKAYDYGVHGARDRRIINPPDVNTLNPDALRDANLSFVVTPGVGLVQQAFIGPMSAYESTQLNTYGLTICGATLPMNVVPAGTFQKASACTGPGPAIPAATAFPTFSDLPPNQAVNYGDIESVCSTIADTRRSSFGAAPWGTSFTDNTRFSWHFQPQAGVAPGAYPLPIAPTQIFDASTNDSLVVKSIVGRCQILDTATRVNALLGCDELVINSRVNPLEINGTIIAGKTNIDPDALVAGITWRSLRDPQTMYGLRTGVSPPLISHDLATPCGNVLAIPEFSTIGDMIGMSTARSCSTLSLVEGTDPFNWTTVDPDCGVASGTTHIQCMRRPIKFSVKEISRVSSY